MTRIATRTAAVLALTATLFIGAVAVAGPHRGPESAVIHAIKELDLTDEQRKLFKEIRESNRDDHEARRTERDETMEIFKTEMQTDKPDAKRLHALIDKRHAESLQHMHDRLDTALEIQSILTPTQRKELAEKMSEMRERHEAERGERREERGERRKGERRSR